MKRILLSAFAVLLSAHWLQAADHYRSAILTVDGKVTTSSSSARVTLSVNGESKSVYFSGTPGNWAPGRNTFPIEIPIGDTVEATVLSTWGVSDYRIRAKQNSSDTLAAFNVEIEDTKSSGILKSQIAGGTFDMRASLLGHSRRGERAGELNYLEAVDFGEPDYYGQPSPQFRLHLGAAGSGESNGSIRAKLNQIGSGSTLGMILEEGRGLLDVASLPNSKRQILTEANLTVIEKATGSDVRVSFYPKSSFTISGGTYTVTGPYSVSYLFTKPGGGVTRAVRTRGSESFNLDYTHSYTSSTVVIDEYESHKVYDHTYNIYPWYKTGTSSNRRIETKMTSKLVSVEFECDSDGWIEWPQSRLMTHYEGSTIVYQERLWNQSRSYGKGDLAKGIDDPAQRTDANYYKARTSYSPKWTSTYSYKWEHGGGHVRTNYYKSDHAGTNLGSNPFAAIGEPMETKRSFKDADEQLITTYNYQASGDQLAARLASAVTKLGTQTVASDTRSYSENTFSHRSGQPLPAVTETRTVATSPGQPSLVSTRRHYRETISDPYFAKKPISVVNPDGSKTSYGYERGVWNGSSWTYSSTGTDLRVVSITGRNASGVSSFQGMNLDPVAIDSSHASSYELSWNAPLAETIYSKFGNPVSEASWVHVNGAFQLVSRKVRQYDGEGNLVKVSVVSSGADLVEYEASYVNGRKAWEKDLSGHQTSYEYDSATGFLKKATREAVGAEVPAVVTDYVVDSLGRVVKETVGGQLVTERAYDQAGRVAWEKAPGGYQTTYAYDYNETGTSSKTVTYPDGSTKVEVRHRDGRIKSVSGTAVPDMTYAYAYSGGRLETTETASSGEWSRTTVDQVGRVVQTEAPKHGGGTSKTVRSYNGSGQLVKEEYLTGSTKIRPSSLYQYDSYGQLWLSASDTDNDGVLDLDTDANARMYQHMYIKLKSAPYDPLMNFDQWHYRYAELVYGFDNNSSWIVDSMTYTQLSGFHSTFAGYQFSQGREGNYTYAKTSVDQAAKKITIDVNAPGSTTDLRTVIAGGVTLSERNDQGHVTTYEYDAQGRLEMTKDPRGLETDITYYKSSTAATTGTAMPASIVEHDGQQTHFGYYSHGGQEYAQDHLGKRSYARIDPATRTTYTWGDAAQPTKTIHDDLGRIRELHTYRGAISSWTSMSGAGDKTAWTYHGSTGLPYQKIDAQGRTTTYSSYDAAGRLTHSIDPRGVDTYQYYYDVAYAGSKKFSGLLREVYYNVSGTSVAATPRERYEYHRRHLSTTRMSRETSPGSGSYHHWDYDYDDLESGEGSTLRLLGETLPSGHYGSGRTFSYGYENLSGGYDPASSGVHGRLASFSFIGDSTYRNAYAYSSNGQLDTIAPTHQSSTAFDYDYLANSNLVSRIQRGSSSYRQQTTYASNSYLKTDVVTSWNGGNVTHVKIGHDALKRVSLHRVHGSIGIWSSGGGSGLYENFTYNDRSELNVTNAYQLTSSWGATSWFDSRDYDFDSMGNLTNRKEGSQNQAHVANNLNQYATAWNDGSSRSISYDLAGNMTSDGVYSYTYDAKNQLVSMSGAGKTATFTYDPQGRRISKAVTGYSEVRFAYDGWNLVAELNSSGAVLKKYTWGLDASGSFQGAGGVGGLLMIEQGSSQYYPVYDGRQNVIGLHNSSGTLVAWYEYDPFGRLLGSGGSAVAVNPFRFSTKYTDHEMDKDLVYYGLRYYHAEMGRFINRDPIEEAGGLNLYGFVGNSPTNYYDMLGMYEATFNDDGTITFKGTEEEAKAYAQAIGKVTGGEMGVNVSRGGDHIGTAFEDSFVGPLMDASDQAFTDILASGLSDFGGDYDETTDPSSTNHYDQGSISAASEPEFIADGIGFESYEQVYDHYQHKYLNIPHGLEITDWDRLKNPIGLLRAETMAIWHTTNKLEKLAMAWPIKAPKPRNANYSLDSIKKALAQVHAIVGKQPKGAPGSFGSPQAGTSVKGYRLDPAHPRAEAGSPESVPHINYWDYTKGKRGKGGIEGAIPIE